MNRSIGQPLSEFGLQNVEKLLRRAEQKRNRLADRILVAIDVDPDTGLWTSGHIDFDEETAIISEAFDAVGELIDKVRALQPHREPATTRTSRAAGIGCVR